MDAVQDQLTSEGAGTPILKSVAAFEEKIIKVVAKTASYLTLAFSYSSIAKAHKTLISDKFIFCASIQEICS